MFIISNFFENFDKSFIVELFILFFIIFSLFFFSFIQLLNKIFFNPLLVDGYLYISNFVLLITFILLLDFFNFNMLFCNFRFIFDSFTFFSKLFIIFFSICFFFSALNENKFSRFRLLEYLFVIWISIFSFFCLAESFDFFVLFLVIELQSLSLYLLATFNYRSLYSTEAGLKYFTLSSFSTGFILFGLLLLYGVSGTLNFEELQKFLQTALNFTDWIWQLSFFALLLIFVGFLFKLTAAPFHFWAVDVYDGSPSLSVLFFLILPKIVLFLVFFRLFYFLFSFDVFFLHLLLLVSLFSVLVGNFAALFELKVKRLITYSGIANVGLLLISIFLFSYEGLQLLFFFSLSYFVILILFFNLFFAVRSYTSNKDMSLVINSSNFFVKGNYIKLKYIEDFVSMFFAHPLIAWLFALTIFSLAGIPPLLGFFFKFFVIFILSKDFFYFVCFFLILLNFIAYIYYGRFLRVLFFDNLFKNYYWRFFLVIPKLPAYIISIFSIINVTFFLLFLPFFIIIEFFVLNVIFF